LNNKFIKGLDNYSKTSKPVVATIGTFDGIHRGHQKILSKLAEKAKEMNATPLLITFHPHPRVLVSPSEIPLLLTTIEEKGKFIPDFFSGDVLILTFDETLKDLSYEEFVKNILVDKIGIVQLVVGYDHALGKDRKGSIEQLTKSGKLFSFGVDVIEPVLVDEKPVSSSRIRKEMLKNQFFNAIDLLGHDYAIYGIVERGIGLGRKLGYPTANLNYNNRKLLPPEGVYACKVWIGSDLEEGMMFIGRNHFNPEKKISVEAHLFNFDRDIYDEEITVYPTHFVRENMKFDSKDELIEQLVKDENNIKEIIKKEKENGNWQGAKSSNYC